MSVEMNLVQNRNPQNIGAVSNDEIIHDVIPRIYEEAHSNFLSAFWSRVVWAWEVAVETLMSEWVVISLIFSAVFAAFGFANMIQAAIASSITWFSMLVCQEHGASNNLDQMRGQILSLRLRNDETMDQMELARMRQGHAERNLQEAEQEIQRLRQLRDQLLMQGQQQ